MKKWLWGLGGLLGLTLVYSGIEPYWQKIRHYTVHNHKLPKDFNGFKIVFLADIHYGRTLKGNKLEKLIKKINDYEPDLILLGGDYVIKDKYIKECFNCLSELKAKHGTYAVIGNHDVVEGLDETLKCMRRANITSVNNDSVWIHKKSRIKVGGVGDLWTQEQVLEKTTYDTTQEDFTILLTHNPKFIYELGEKDNVDLVLAGHTHGGQFTPMRHLGKVAPEHVNRATGLQFLSGKKHLDGRDIIVSNGVGTAKFPLRLMARPDIITITLKNK